MCSKLLPKPKPGSKQASQPDIGATRNDAAINLFGKPLIELTPQELDKLDDEIN